MIKCKDAIKMRCEETLEFVYPVIRNFRYLYNSRKLKNRDITIISNNCWGSLTYKRFGLKYNTPFVGLFIFAPDYIKLLKNLRYYLGCDLNFTETSKYKKELIKNNTLNAYPIGVLDDVELHFVHYRYVFSWPASRLAFGDYSILSVPMLPVSS